MFYSNAYDFKILSVHSLSWGVQKKYAYPRPFNALSFRVNGQALFTHNNQTFKACKNDVIFVPKDYDYVIDSRQEEKVIVIHFDSKIQFDSIEIFSPTSPEIIASLFLQIEKIYLSRLIGYKQKIHSIFYQILEQFEIQQGRSKVLKLDVSEHFEKSLDYLKLNFHNPSLTVNLLANISKISCTYYRKVFKKIFGVSPNKYITDFRLSRAKILLETGYYTVEQVATTCGFNDSKYFATCYKNKYSHSPSKDVPKLFETK